MILYIMIGVPGAGKSYFAENVLLQNENLYYVSRDKIRYLLVKNDEEYFSKEDEVFNQFVWEIQNILTSKTIPYCGVIADATHLNWASRRKLIRAIERYIPIEKIDIIPVVINATIEDILARNNLREGRARVPENAIYSMYNKLSDPEKDPFKYTAIMRVNN